LPRNELLEAVDLIYAAALDEGANWQDLGDKLMTLMKAQRATLWLADEAGTPGNLLMRRDSYDEEYATRYVLLDPYRAAAREVSVEETVRRRGDVRLGHEIIPDASYVKSEFYDAFGRKSSRRFMVGGLISVSKVIPLGLHRDAASRPFDEDDKRTLSQLLPHLQRGLQMRDRLAPTPSSLGAGALDALPIGVIVVDRDMRILYNNAEAAALLGDSQSGLSSAVHRPGPVTGARRLFARHPVDDAQLCRLVDAASRGGAGGGMQIHARSGALPGDSAMLSALICPALRHLSSSTQQNMGTSVVHGAATVLTRHLLRPSPPPARLLIDLFGLTRAEAEVAVALAGGVTAENVARTRRVSLDTVRSQIRTMLRKTGATGLRDFERIIALSSTMHTTQRAAAVHFVDEPLNETCNREKGPRDG
jgi:DNA-binding CsgD family transcriptional regulator/PAS domain-containing protein